MKEKYRGFKIFNLPPEYFTSFAVTVIFSAVLGVLPSGIITQDGEGFDALMRNIDTFFKPEGGFLDFYISALITGSIFSA